MHTDACLNSKNSIQPPLKKTILYLDQNAISNLAHARYQTGTQTTKTWLELNEKLEDAVRKQLIICPVSLAHQLESAVNPQLFNAFMGTSEYFAGGCSFTSFESIKDHQLQTYFTAYLENIAPPFRLDPVDVVEPNPHRWIDVPTIKPNWQMSQEEVDGLRGVRGNSSRECANVFQHWKKFPKRNFDEWLAEESQSRSAYGQRLLPILPEMANRRDLDLSHLQQAAMEFIETKIAGVPFIKLSSLLSASAAMKAQNQTEPPDIGTLADFQVISHLLPYCDAMFLDQRRRADLEELRAKRIKFDTRIFSAKLIPQLISYVDNLGIDQLRLRQ